MNTTDTTPAEALLPCPFCGESGQLNEHEGRITSGHYTAQVVCSECDEVKGACAAEYDKALAAKHAIEYWNTRPKPQPAAVEKKWPGPEHNRCCAGRDGDCNWPHCPQNRDGEPMKSGRHCPLDVYEELE